MQMAPCIGIQWGHGTRTMVARTPEGIGRVHLQERIVNQQRKIGREIAVLLLSIVGSAERLSGVDRRVAFTTRPGVDQRILSGLEGNGPRPFPTPQCLAGLVAVTFLTAHPSE